MTIPEPAFFHLIAELTERYHEGPLSEFELARYTMQAKELYKAHPPMGLCAQGIIAAIKNDEQKMREYHERSIVASGDNALYLFNYASSLHIMGLNAESMEMLIRTIEADPLSRRFLNRTIWIAYNLKDSRLPELLERWEKLNDELHPVVEEMVDETDIKMALASVEADGTISWDELRKELQ